MMLHGFQSLRPRFEVEQQKILEWVAAAHTQAEASKQTDFPKEEFHNTLQEKIFSLGLGEEKVKKRGVHFGDVLHTNWNEMEIYNLEKNSEGHHHTERLDFYNKSVTEIFEQFYPENAELPSHLIHATCTGYCSPSGAQKIVSKRGYGQRTIVTHAYHMGCYASIPAIRIGMGFFNTSPSPIDIVHTEMCTLHMNPLLHSTDQLVIQSLFSDGFIKYSLSANEEGKPAFRILDTHEETIPNSTHSMTWQCANWGMAMSLDKDVPVLIARSLKSFVDKLIDKAEKGTRLFAIHPGGPKIIQQVAKVLDLHEEQIAHSQEVLKNYGNMSSATLPHIWQSILNDTNIPKKTQVISLAFGPGLSISGALFETC